MSEETGESGDTIADRRVHPATVPLRFVKEAPQTLLGIPAGYAFISDVGLYQVLGFAGLVALVAILYQWLAWRRFRYGIGAGEIVIEKGILSRTRRSIPFARIQDVDIERGPLARLFGLAKLRIETGGSGGDEGVLDSVTVAEAERIRGALRQAKSDGMRAAEIEQAPEPELLYAMAIPRVLAAGLFNFSMVWLAGLFAFLQTFENWLPFDIYDPARWVGLADERLDGRFSAGAILTVALLALLLGVLTGVARTLARDFGFRLTLQAEGFRRVRGLFTRSEVLLPKRRIQLAVAETGPVRRYFGWRMLSFQTLSAGRPGEAGRQSVAPLADEDEAARVLAAQDGWHLADPEALTRVSKRHLVRRLVTNGLFPFLALGAALLFLPGALLALPLLPILVVVALFQRRFHRYGIADGLLFVTHGIFRQRQWVIPLERIQSLRLSRSWLQRRLDLATLSIDTAGAPSLDPPRILDLKEDVARALAAELRGRSG